MTLRADVTVRREGFVLRGRLRVGPGETVALLGPNGSGKSTLVEALAGLLPPDEGEVVLDGRPLDAPGVRVPPERRPVGVVFQDRLLFPHLTALENVAFPLRARGVRPAEARERAGALLARLGVGHVARTRPGRLSGGEAQRVALARALIHQPRLLLLDEPLAALDVGARGKLRSLLRRTLAGFEGVRLLVTHDPVEAMSLAERLVLLEGGRVTQEGTPDAIRAAPRSRYAAELVGVNLFRGRLVRLPDGAGALETPTGAIVTAWPPGAEEPVEEVLGVLSPADVSLFLDPPEGSARNLLRGPVESVDRVGDRARVRVASAPPVVAEVTLGSARRLGLREGVPVWASFKAVEVRLVLP